MGGGGGATQNSGGEGGNFCGEAVWKLGGGAPPPDFARLAKTLPSEPILGLFSVNKKGRGNHNQDWKSRRLRSTS